MDWTITWILLGLAIALVPVLLLATIGERSNRGATSWPSESADDEAGHHHPRHPRAA